KEQPIVKTGGQFIMKRGKRNEGTKTLQRAKGKPGGPKGLAFANAEVPIKRSGTALMVASTKTREELCTELCCDLEKAVGVPLEVADRVASQMAKAQVWPKAEGATEGLIKAITALAEFAPQNCIEASLAAQMTATGEMALMFLNRATIPEQTV